MAASFNPFRRLANAVALWRSEGLRAVWRRIMRSVWVTRRYVVVVKPIDEAPVPEASPDVAFRLASPEDVEWISRDMPQMKGNAAELLWQQFAREDDLTVVGTPPDNPDRIVFALWLSHDDFALTLLGDHWAPDDVSSRRAWVPESHRRQGLATRGFAFVQRAAREAGIPRIWGFIREENVASRKLHERLGYTDGGRIRLKTRLGRRFAEVRLSQERRWRTVPVPGDRHGL